MYLPIYFPYNSLHLDTVPTQLYLEHCVCTFDDDVVVPRDRFVEGSHCLHRKIHELESPQRPEALLTANVFTIQNVRARPKNGVKERACTAHWKRTWPEIYATAARALDATLGITASVVTIPL